MRVLYFWRFPVYILAPEVYAAKDRSALPIPGQTGLHSKQITVIEDYNKSPETFGNRALVVFALQVVLKTSVKKGASAQNALDTRHRTRDKPSQSFKP